VNVNRERSRAKYRGGLFGPLKRRGGRGQEAKSSWRDIHNRGGGCPGLSDARILDCQGHASGERGDLTEGGIADRSSVDRSFVRSFVRPLARARRCNEISARRDLSEEAADGNFAVRKLFVPALIVRR